MDFFPVHLELSGKSCLVVGGGQVALRKATLLVQSGARVKVVAPEVLPQLAELLNKQGSVVLEPYSQVHLNSVFLVVAATNDPQVNRQISVDAESAQILVNVVDDPKLSNFIVPAIIDRSPLLVSVSSGGRAPVLVRLLRAKIEALIPSRYGRLASLVGRYRDRVKSRFKRLDGRRKFWERMLEGRVAELFLSGREQEAETQLLSALDEQGAEGQFRSGEVYLVGAGPGDPDLLTFKALRLMQKADIVLYDRLISDDLLDLVRRDCRRIYVGKSKGDHTLPQSEITQSLVDFAKQGYRICRLKGGDPFIFGRGGEEIDQLFKEKIPVQVVPGVTAASGCACYSGIPLTHRDYSQSVRFVTGHLRQGTHELDWGSLIVPRETLVIYMGLMALPQICEKLLEHGMVGTTPIALIEQGTTEQQRVFTGELETFAKKVEGINQSSPISSPALIIVGDVVKLHNTLNWYQ